MMTNTQPARVLSLSSVLSLSKDRLCARSLSSVLSLSKDRRPGHIGVPSKWSRQQRGMGTMLIMGSVLLLMMLSGVIGWTGQYLVARQRAHAAADLAALAGAQAYGSGQGGCAAAKSNARKNGRTVTGCTIVGEPGDFVLTVTVSGHVRAAVPALPRKISATAHAGPVREGDGH